MKTNSSAFGTLSIALLFLVLLTPALAFALEDDQIDLEEQAAQRIAEEVVHAPFNQNKTRTIERRFTHIESRILAVERRITDLEGKAIQLEERESNVDEALDRLGAIKSDTEIRILLRSSVLFAFDKAELRPDALGKLEDLLEVVRSFSDHKITIEGHTCSIGTNQYNQKLSERRALSVQSWLISQEVSQKRLTTTGHGETRPIEDNATEEGRSKNRRVEIVLRR